MVPGRACRRTALNRVVWRLRGGGMWFFFAIGLAAILMLNLQPRSLDNKDFMMIAGIIGFVMMGLMDRMRR
jgi:UDP-N-acetylmuramyl pentapeptide phosphotransferase/UDP-N-acetylglucosamine-1-phosphate transferase